MVLYLLPSSTQVRSLYINHTPLVPDHVDHMVYLWLDHPTDILEEKDNLELHNINDDDWINDDLLEGVYQPCFELSEPLVLFSPLASCPLGLLDIVRQIIFTNMDKPNMAVNITQLRKGKKK